MKNIIIGALLLGTLAGCNYESDRKYQERMARENAAIDKAVADAVAEREKAQLVIDGAKADEQRKKDDEAKAAADLNAQNDAKITAADEAIRIRIKAANARARLKAEAAKAAADAKANAEPKGSVVRTPGSDK